MAFAMGWEILWPLILGFTLSGVVQAIVSRSEMSRLLPDDRPRSIATALALGAASSSCSYAAVALARSIFRKGANFIAAMAFENGHVRHRGRLFVAAPDVRAWPYGDQPLLRDGLGRGLARHRRGITNRRGACRVGASRVLAIVLPDRPSDSRCPLGSHRRASRRGHLFRLLGWEYSTGRGPWNGGISFGGVIAFIFADLIVLPILNIYRKYYGLKTAGFLFVTFYAAMAVAALIVEVSFGALGLIPAERHARVVEASITWNYTTWLNIAFLAVAGLLVWRFLRTGGLGMLRMMNRPAETGHAYHTH
jgi:hypothetical protein